MRTLCCGSPLSSTRRTITSSLFSAFFNPSTRTRLLFILSSEKLLPSGPPCFAVSKAISGWFKRQACQSV